MILLCGTIVIRCAVDHGPVPDEMRLARQNVRGSSSRCVMLDQRSGVSIVDEYAHVHVGIDVIERMRSIITRWSNGDTCAVAPLRRRNLSSPSATSPATVSARPNDKFQYHSRFYPTTLYR